MSSHKEAPGIVNDAAADNTDVYAFVSPDKPDTVTLIANFVPLQNPAGGPNFYEFGEDVLYEIHVDNTGDAKPDITYQFRFTTEVGNPNTFLYNTGPIKKIGDPTFNRKQFYSVTMIKNGVTTVLNPRVPCPPCNIGPASTPDYANLARQAITDLGGGRTVFAGQRAEGFYVDLGAIFDLGILRPFLDAHLVHMPKSGGINTTKAVNIDSIAIQVPKSDLITGDGKTTTDQKNVIGVYASASRPKTLLYKTDGTKVAAGPFVQVSRLGNPLFNEVINPISQKDKFNATDPVDDAQFAGNVTTPQLGALLPVLYPGVFPKLAAFNKKNKPRNDLAAILLTGIPGGVVPGFAGNNTGKVQADLLRLNTAIKPATDTKTTPSNLGLLGKDVAGFPNGRRVFDDVTTIELRAIAGAVLPLVDKNDFPSADAAAGAITEGLTSSNKDMTAYNTVHYLQEFPYLGTPHSGYRNPSNDNPAPDLGAINQNPANCHPVPVGAPNTGIGPAPESGSNTGLLVGSGLAAAGVLAATGVAKRQGVLAGAGAMRPRPAPRQAEQFRTERTESEPESDE